MNGARRRPRATRSAWCGRTSLDKKVYVHCKNGHGRAPTLVAAYLITRGQSVEEAIAFVSQRRSGVHLEGVQRGALEEFADAALVGC